jgi:hypothetical protein
VAFPLLWPAFYSSSSLFRCLSVDQWDFCLGIISLHTLCLSQCNPTPLYFLIPFPLSCVNIC